jgi:preprotein translocase subunit SecF
LTAYRGLNLGIDFVGGQVVRATFAQPVNIEDLRGKVATLNVGEASIQEFGDNKTYQIRLPKPEGPDAAANKVVTVVRGMIVKDYPGVKVTAGESVSGKVSGELAWDGALAIAFAMIGIAVYIWFRFEWQFGVGALVTLFHDVSMVLGFFSLTQLQVDLNISPPSGDRRLFAQRHGRHLRPDSRGYAQVSQDADPGAAQPVAQRNAVPHHGDLAVADAGTGRVAGARA